MRNLERLYAAVNDNGKTVYCWGLRENGKPITRTKDFASFGRLVRRVQDSSTYFLPKEWVYGNRTFEARGKIYKIRPLSLEEKGEIREQLKWGENREANRSYC